MKKHLDKIIVIGLYSLLLFLFASDVKKSNELKKEQEKLEQIRKMLDEIDKYI